MNKLILLIGLVLISGCVQEKDEWIPFEPDDGEEGQEFEEISEEEQINPEDLIANPEFTIDVDNTEIFPILIVDCSGIKNSISDYSFYSWAFVDCAMLETMIYETEDYHLNATGPPYSINYYANLESFNKTFYDYNICYIVHNQSVGKC